MKVFCGPFQPELEEAFIAGLTRARPGESLAVVAPSRRMADRLQRLVAVERGLSILGARFHTFHSLAVEVVAGARPPGGLAAEGLFHDRIVDGILRRRGRRSSRGLGASYRSTLRDLADAGVSPEALLPGLEELLPEPDRARARELLEVLKDYQRRLGELGVLAPAGLTRLATELVESGAAGLGRYTRFLYYGFYDLTGAQADFFSSVAAAAAVEVYFPFVQGHPAFAFAQRLLDLRLHGGEPPVHLKVNRPGGLSSALDALFSPGHVAAPSGDGGSRTAAPRPDGVDFIGASGVEGQAWAIAKEILALRDRDEAHFSEVGIVVRTHEGFRAALEAALAENEIPYWTAAGRPVLSHPAAKLAYSLLTWRRRDFPADTPLALLDSPYFIPENSGRVLESWRRLLAGLQIHSGWIQWEGRLEPCTRSDFQLDARRTGGRAGRVVSKEDGARLWRLVVELRAGLAWAGSCRQTSERAGRVLRRVMEVPRSDPGRAAWEAALESLEGLAAFDAAGVEGEEEFWETFEERLRGAELAAPPPNGGVRLLDAMEARGESFKILFLAGLNEGIWPRRVREDPLLTDRARRVLRDSAGYWIAPKLEGYDEERLLFWLAAASATRRLCLVYGRSDDHGRPCVPSLYLREFARACGVDIDAARQIPRQPLARLAQASPVLRSPRELSVLVAERGGSVPVDGFGIDGELRTRSLGSAAGLNRRGEAGPRDGILGPGAASSRRRPLSPSGLESFSRCPFQFFASRWLGLGEEDEPLSRGELPSSIRGEIYHGILRRFRLKTADATRGDKDWPEALRQAAEEVLGAAALGLYPVLWEAERRRMLRHLERFAAQDIARSRAGGWRPQLMEEELSGEIAGLRLRGRPDRVDVSSDGRLRVIDYKTSAPWAGSLERQIVALKNHQFPVYLELARRRFPASCGASAALSAIEDSPETTGVSGWMDLSEEAWSRLREPYLRNLASLGAMIGKGSFFITPDEDRGGPCGYCRFAALCRKSHPPTRRRAEESSAARELRRLREGSPPPVEVPEGAP